MQAFYQEAFRGLTSGRAALLAASSALPMCRSARRLRGCTSAWFTQSCEERLELLGDRVAMGRARGARRQRLLPVDQDVGLRRQHHLPELREVHHLRAWATAG